MRKNQFFKAILLRIIFLFRRQEIRYVLSHSAAVKWLPDLTFCPKCKLCALVPWKISLGFTKYTEYYLWLSPINISRNIYGWKVNADTVLLRDITFLLPWIVYKHTTIISLLSVMTQRRTVKNLKPQVEEIQGQRNLQ